MNDNDIEKFENGTKEERLEIIKRFKNEMIEWYERDPEGYKKFMEEN